MCGKSKKPLDVYSPSQMMIEYHVTKLHITYSSKNFTGRHSSLYYPCFDYLIVKVCYENSMISESLVLENAGKM